MSARRAGRARSKSPVRHLVVALGLVLVALAASAQPPAAPPQAGAGGAQDSDRPAPPPPQDAPPGETTREDDAQARQDREQDGEQDGEQDDGAAQSPAVAPAAPTAVPAAEPAPEPVPAPPATTAPPAAAPPAEPAPPVQAPQPEPAPGADLTSPVQPVSAAVEQAGEAQTSGDDRTPWTLSASFGQTLGLATLFADSTLSYNPLYSWGLFAGVAYNFTPLTRLALTQGASLELTDSETTVARQQFMLTDTRLTLSDVVLQHSFSEQQSLMLVVAGGLILPASDASQAASLLFGARGAIAALYNQNDVLDGLLLSLGFAYTRRFATSNTSQADTSFPCVLGGGDASRECFHMGGFANTRDLFLLSLDASLTVSSKVVLGASFSLGWDHKHPLAAVELGEDQILTGARRFEEMSATDFRNNRVIEVSALYVLDYWLFAQAHLTNSFAEIGPDGQRRDPFEPVDTVVGLVLSAQLGPPPPGQPAAMSGQGDGGASGGGEDGKRDEPGEGGAGNGR